MEDGEGVGDEVRRVEGVGVVAGVAEERAVGEDLAAVAASLAVDEGASVRSYHWANGAPCFRFQLAAARLALAFFVPNSTSCCTRTFSFDMEE